MKHFLLIFFPWKSSSDTSAETVTRQQPFGHVFNLSQSPQQPMYYQYYRRQTPEEDYLSTQQAKSLYISRAVTLVEQDTIDYVFTAYVEPKTISKKHFDHQNMKKSPSKVAHNRPKFVFSLLPTGPKPAQISHYIP